MTSTEQSSATGQASQACLAIAMMRATRGRWRLYGGILDEHSLLGLELDDVLLGADPLPPSSHAETKYRRWINEQKEVERERLAKEEAAARAHAAWQNKQRELDARRKAEWEAHRAVKEEQKRVAFQEREKALAGRWAEQATARAVFADRFAPALMEDARQQGSVFDLCSECGDPFWILYDNLVNWSRYWKGQPRCLTCYCPALTERVRRENPTWSRAHVTHEIVMSIMGSGAYAWAPELVAMSQIEFPRNAAVSRR